MKTFRRAMALSLALCVGVVATAPTSAHAQYEDAFEGADFSFEIDGWGLLAGTLLIGLGATVGAAAVVGGSALTVENVYAHTTELAPPSYAFWGSLSAAALQLGGGATLMALDRDDRGTWFALGAGLAVLGAIEGGIALSTLRLPERGEPRPVEGGFEVTALGPTVVAASDGAAPGLGLLARW